MTNYYLSYIKEFLKNTFSSIEFLNDIDKKWAHRECFKFNDVADEAYFQLSMLNEEIEV
jgi:hypothetical protein